MKKIITLLLLVCLLALAGCNNKPMDEPEEDIYKAKEYAVSVFNDTMPDDYVIVATRSSIRQDASDNVYEIIITYTIGSEDKEYSYGYKISVDGTDFSVLEEIDYSKLTDIPIN